MMKDQEVKQKKAEQETYFEYGHCPMGVVSVEYEDILWIHIEMNKVVISAGCIWLVHILLWQPARAKFGMLVSWGRRWLLSRWVSH